MPNAPPAVTLTAPQSPTRLRSVSQPIREDVASQFFPYNPSSSSPGSVRSGITRTSSYNANQRSAASTSALSVNGPPPVNTNVKGRARSSSLVTVTEVGANEPEGVVDRMGVGTNENAAWVNAPGAWLIHPVIVLFTKVLIDAIPGMTQDVSWTIVNLGYLAVTFLMFHHVTGVPFESQLTTGGAYDDLTLWEQIDSGAQYTPAKKWLTSVPIGLYDYILFAVNFSALVFILFPKLPIVSTVPASLHADPNGA
ncbi:hypothetical protein P7C73_g1743, partial [Tremellales sp. Uapishka_1]